MNEDNTYEQELLPSVFQDALPVEKKPYSRSDFMKYIAQRVSELLDKQTDLLFSTLYRMDISESEIERVFNGQTDESVPDGLARLILERQEERMRTREKFKVKNTDFKWSLEEE